MDLVGRLSSRHCLQGFRCIVLLLLLGAAFATSRTEIQTHLESDYLGKFFVIRCLCVGDVLVYDMGGHVIHGDRGQESWTTAEVEIAKLEVHGKELEIRGQRTAILFDAASHSPKRQHRMKALPKIPW